MTLMAWLVVITAALVVVRLAVLARRLTARALVGHASLRNDEIGKYLRLVPIVARRVHPVRLSGIGGAMERFDLSLIDERPDLDLLGVPARDLAPPATRSYVLFHPAYLELWTRSGPVSYRRVAAFPITELKGIAFITHDPDGIGVIDDVYRGSAGTLKVTVAERTHLYLMVLVKPEQALMGPRVTHEG